MESQVVKVKRELVRRRGSGMLLWISVLQPVLAWLVAIILTLDLTQPTRWMSSFEIVMSFDFWLYVFLCCVSVAAFVVAHIRCCTVVPEVGLSRWDSILHLIRRPSNFIGILGHTIMGGVTARWYLGLVADNSVSGLTSVVHRIPCFNDIHFFAVLYGAFSGLLYACSYYLQCKQLLRFSTIQQPRFMLLKGVWAHLMLATFSTVLKYIVGFYLLYFCIGSYARSGITDALNITKSCSLSLGSVAGLLNIRLFWTTFITSFAAVLSWNGSLYLANLFMTQGCAFPIETNPSSDDLVPLHVAMATTSVPYTQYLAYLDFSLLSQSSKSRRQLLFNLSHPGGHPHNWKCIINECLALLYQLTAHLNSAGEPSKPAAVDNVSKASCYERLSGSDRLSSDRMHLAGNCSALEHQQVHPGSLVLPLCRVSPAVVIKRWFVRRFKQVWHAIKIWYVAFVRRRSELNKQCLFLDCQPHIWAAEGLSFLVAASLTEDKFGVVQPDLQDIITVLCDLHQCLEKQIKWVPARSTKGMTRQLNTRLKTGLSAAVRAALYRIATKFKDHLSSIPLSSECREILQQYASYSK